MPSSHIGGAVVTGAASGIGRAIATGLAADGFPVVIADLDEVKGRAVAGGIGGGDGRRAVAQRGVVRGKTSGITVNAFAPGVVDTPLWIQLDKDLMAMGASAAPGEAMRSYSSSILLGRAAQPADVVGTVRFLASPASDYMTGQVLMIDGGMILQ